MEKHYHICLPNVEADWVYGYILLPRKYGTASAARATIRDRKWFREMFERWAPGCWGRVKSFVRQCDLGADCPLAEVE